MIHDNTVHVKVSEYVWRNFSKFSNILKNYSTKKGVKYPFEVRFRSFKSLNIKMSHSVVQKNHLPSEFMSIYS